MYNERNTKKTIVALISNKDQQKTNWLFPATIRMLVFLFFIMAFPTSAYLQSAYTIHFGTDVEIQGNYAYVAVTGTSHAATDVIYSTPPSSDLPSGLRVIDISNPYSPEIVGGLNYSNSGILCLTIAGDLVYLSYSGAEGVKIIDISTPEVPQIVGTIPNVYAREIVVRDYYAYIADPESGLVIVDVSAPATPIAVARVTLNGTVDDIAIQGDFAYLTFNDDDYPIECGLHVCDISNPQNPFLVDRFVVSTGFDSDVQVSDRMKIWISGPYAYCAKETALIIVDISDPHNLSREKTRRVWHLPGMPPYYHVPSAEELTGSGEYLYVIGDLDNQEDFLFAVSISDPLNPDLLGDVSIYRPNGVAVQGNYACIAGRDGFQVIDISNPYNSSVIGEIGSIDQSSSGTVGTSASLPSSSYNYFSSPIQYNPNPAYNYPITSYSTTGGYGYFSPSSSLGVTGGYPFRSLGITSGYAYPFTSLNTTARYTYPFSSYNTAGSYAYPFSSYSTTSSYTYPYNSYNPAGGYAYPSNPFMTYPSYPAGSAIGFTTGFPSSYNPYNPLSFSSFSSIGSFNSYQTPYSLNPYSPFSMATPSSYYPYSTPSATDTCLSPGLYGKPAIYLYPPEDTHVRVELDIDGTITRTIPPYNDGWRVFATTDGTIIEEENGTKFDYLFWEAEADLSEFDPPAQGWVVAREDMEAWFDEYLVKLGLIEKEKVQCMDFWVDLLKESKYYEIQLLSAAFLEEHAKLTIAPAPDTLIRVIFYFTPLDTFKTLEAPVIETPSRDGDGFVVLEWGGILSQ